MSKEQYNYLTLDGDGDKKEPLMNESEVFRNDSSQLCEEDNFLSKIQTIKTVEEKENDAKEYKPEHSSSNNEDPSHVKDNLEFYKKKQEEAIKKLIWACVICTIFMIIEIIGGYLSNSIAIMSDAAHLLSDLFGFFISIISIYISRKVSKNNISYGYHRAEIIGVLVSIFLIWALTIWLLYEATIRIMVTPPVNGLIMILIAFIGLGFNLIIGIILEKAGAPHSHELHYHRHENDHDNPHGEENHHDNDNEEIALHEEENENTNVNLRASFMNVLGNALQNIGVLIAGAIITLFPNFSIADPICTYIFSIIVGLTTISTLKDYIFILMEGSPVAIDIDELEEDLKNIKGVKEIHDLHVWSLSIGKISLSCHICCTDPQKTLKKAKKMIQRKYKIEHITIQVEENNNTNQIC